MKITLKDRMMAFVVRFMDENDMLIPEGHFLVMNGKVHEVEASTGVRDGSRIRWSITTDTGETWEEQ